MLELLKEHEVDALLVSKPENIRYLSGFTGGRDARLLVLENEKYIFTDSRYSEQVARECNGWKLIEEKPPGFEKLIEMSGRCKKIGTESHDITYQFYLEMEKSLGAEIIPLPNIIESLRIIKDESELKLLRETARISDEVFKETCNSIKPGLAERQIAIHIVNLLKEKGCEKESFDTIVVSGENASLPHGKPGEKELNTGDMVTMDFGGFFKGYAGDMTRTIVIGKAPERLKYNYLAVLEAQKLGVSLVKAGESCRDIDQKIRVCLSKYNLENYFIHSTGHGVGLEIHEQPSVSSRSEVELQENMVITIEPGIYIPGWGGIRIEDTVIVKEKGCEVITHSDKNLLII